MESSPKVAVQPTKPAAPYIGGKRNLARRLVDLIEATPHRTYAEPFLGMGGVFLRRRSRPPAEVVNDWSRDVWTFYRVLQEHYAFFRETLRFQLTSRAEFERLVAVDPDTLTDIQRAARFLYLQRTAFGGKVTGRNFGVPRHRGGQMDMSKLGVVLEELHERLAGVVVERLHWAAFLKRYDTPETLFYLDPPYYGCESDYGAELFSREEFAVMADALWALKGRFILSLNDRPQVREIFAGFTITRVSTQYGIAGQGSQEAQEVIIRDSSDTLPGVEPAWAAAIGAWAVRTKAVRAVHVYGSRARGDHRPASDLDLAVELAGADTSERLAEWMDAGEGWAAELQAKIPVRVHLELGHEVDTPRVWSGVQADGVTIFSRG